MIGGSRSGRYQALDVCSPVNTAAEARVAVVPEQDFHAPVMAGSFHVLVNNGVAIVQCPNVFPAGKGCRYDVEEASRALVASGLREGDELFMRGVWPVG